jgi:hypothetical protein
MRATTTMAAGMVSTTKKSKGLEEEDKDDEFPRQGIINAQVSTE